jgi:hypothetical protein
MLVDVAMGLREVELLQRRVVRAGPGDQDVVDGPGELREEPRQAVRVRGVERCGAQRADLARRVLQPLRGAAGEGDLGPCGAGQPGGLQPDPGAAADDHDGLTVHVETLSSAAVISCRSALSAST